MNDKDEFLEDLKNKIKQMEKDKEEGKKIEILVSFSYFLFLNFKIIFIIF